jgi:hypothetical protein
MFFNKSKLKLEMHYRIIGLKPFADYNLLDLIEMQAFLDKVTEKVYSKDELAMIKEKYLPSGAQWDDFILQELKVDLIGNKIISESHKLFFGEKAPVLKIPKGIIDNGIIQRTILDSHFTQLCNLRVIPSFSSKFFTLETWGELAERFLNYNVSLGGDFEWWTAYCKVYEIIENGEIVVVVSSIE